MNTELFAPVEFERLESPVFAKALASRLQEAVLRELEPLVGQAMAKVVAELNATGHNLTPYGSRSLGEFQFRDESLGGSCRLRLACDVIISAGYADTYSENV